MSKGTDARKRPAPESKERKASVKFSRKTFTPPSELEQGRSPNGGSRAMPSGKQPALVAHGRGVVVDARLQDDNICKVYVKTAEATYEPNRYHTTNVHLKQVLNQYGVAVLDGVLSREEVQKMNSGMWDAVEEMTADFSGRRTTKTDTRICPISRHDKGTWGHIRQLLPIHRFLLQHWSIGHAKYAWDVRGNSKVCDAFSAIHGVEPSALLSSFDGVGIFLPGSTGTRARAERLWLHTDQRFNYDQQPLRHSVQAWVTGYDVDEGCATLAFLEGSHKHHHAFAERFQLTGHSSDWYKLERQAEYDFLRHECQCALRAVQCRAGSMVLFDSRLFHCGMGPPAGTQAVPRNVVYVCMAPRKWCSDPNRRKRQVAFEGRRLTSHCPHVPKLFPKTPRTYGVPVQGIRPPPMYSVDEMTPGMRSLVPL